MGQHVHGEPRQRQKSLRGPQRPQGCRPLRGPEGRHPKDPETTLLDAGYPGRRTGACQGSPEARVEDVAGNKKGPDKPHRKATPGSWKEDLTPEQARIVEELTVPILDEFYPERSSSYGRVKNLDP